MFYIFASSQSIPTAIQRFTAANYIGAFFVYIEDGHSTFCASISFCVVTVVVWCRDVAVATALKEERASLQNLPVR